MNDGPWVRWCGEARSKTVVVWKCRLTLVFAPLLPEGVWHLHYCPLQKTLDLKSHNKYMGMCLLLELLYEYSSAMAYLLNSDPPLVIRTTCE